MAEVRKKGKKSSSVALSTAEAIETVEGRIPPQAVEIEKAVLGALLLEKDAFAQVGELLTPESFYVRAHEQIFRAMLELNMSQRPIDLLTITEQLSRMGALESVGGSAYISDLTERISGAANLEYHAHIVAQKALSRRLISFSTEVLTRAYDDTEDVEDQMQQAEGDLFQLSQNNLKKDVRPVSSILKDAIQEIQNAANKAEGVSGCPSGFPAIDNLTSGWQKSDLIIIAARPAMGKTAFVLSMAKNIAVDNNIPVAIFNLEMSATQVVKRLISNVCEIQGELIKNGRLEPYQWTQLDSKLREIDGKPLYIDDTPGLSIFELRTKARRLVREKKVELIIIDYLQLLNASGMNFGNREQEVSMISRSLKILAKELNIPIIALSQLNRSVETRKADNNNSKKPQLSDLRESGAIEQDADIVCFIHRPEYYGILEDAYGSTEGIGEFIVAKHRNGAVDTLRLSFRKEFVKFVPLESESIITRSSQLGNNSYAAPQESENSLSSSHLSSDFSNRFITNEEDMPF